LRVGSPGLMRVFVICITANGSLSNNHLLLVKTGEIKPGLDLSKIL
jgi:hypothetical protein